MACKGRLCGCLPRSSRPGLLVVTGRTHGKQAAKHQPRIGASLDKLVVAHDWGGLESLRLKQALVTTFFKLSRSISMRLSSTRNCLISSHSRCWTQPVSAPGAANGRARRANALGTGQITLPSPNCYLPHALRFKSERVYLESNRQTAVIQFFYGQWLDKASHYSF